MTFPYSLWKDLIKQPQECAFCGEKMQLAWDGPTPHANFLAAYICPECFSTRFLCSDKNDPMFQILIQIQEAFMSVWKSKELQKEILRKERQIEGGDPQNV
jgi:hypothetical protein